MTDLPGPVTPSGITGSALLAVTGVGRAIETKPSHIGTQDKQRAEMLPREIRRAARTFVDDETGGPRKVPARKAFDYVRVMDRITSAVETLTAEEQGGAEGMQFTAKRHEALANAFGPNDTELGVEYLNAAEKAVNYLQGILPVRLEQTMAQSVNIDPSDTEIARFRRAYEVADDLMVILRDMDLGILVTDQVKHLAALFPDEYKEMKRVFSTEMGNALARKKSWKLSWRRDRLVQVLFQTTTFNQDLARDLQDGFAKAQKPDQGPKAGIPSTTASKAAQNVQTSVSQVADGKAT